MQRILIGKILKPQGLKGEVKVQAITDDAARFMELHYLYLAEQDEARRDVLHVRVSGQDVFLRLAGVNSREDAEALRGRMLYIDREQSVKLPEGRYLIRDIIGCEVLDSDGKRYGSIYDVFATGSNDVYQIRGEQGEYLFPALKVAMLNVDIEGKTMLVDPSYLVEVP